MWLAWATLHGSWSLGVNVLREPSTHVYPVSADVILAKVPLDKESLQASPSSSMGLVANNSEHWAMYFTDSDQKNLLRTRGFVALIF